MISSHPLPLPTGRSRPLLVSLFLAALISLLPLASAHGQNDTESDRRLERSDLETSLFSANAPSLMASFEEVLAARGLVDLLHLWCQGDSGLAESNQRGSEWFCSETANPKGFPGGGKSHLRLFGNDQKLFALAVLAKQITEIEAEMLHRQLVRAFERECPCRLGDNAVTYCYCASAEVRITQQRAGLGLMVIDDMEQFLSYTLGLDPEDSGTEQTTELDG